MLGFIDISFGIRFPEGPLDEVLRLVAGGAQLRPYSREILTACHKATQETYAEIGDRNARFKQIHAHWDKFRRDSQTWFRVAEDSSANFPSIAERV